MINTNAGAVKWTPKSVDWLSHPPLEPWQTAVVANINFCDSCSKCFGTCVSSPVFGTCSHEDNVVDCAAYEQEERGRKCFACGYAGVENKFRRFCAACHRGI